MTADLDLSPEAVERLANDLEHANEYEPLGHDGWTAAALLRALAAENARLRAEDEASAHDIARLKDSETHWLNEADRLRAERDAAWQAGAVAMREAAIQTAFAEHKKWCRRGLGSTASLMRAVDAIRAMPLPGQPKEAE